jgi:CubicO group peptidase (beta-lactamase class C family)
MEDSIMQKIKISRNLLIIMVYSLAFSACLKEEPLKMPFQTYTPFEMSDGWEIATPADVNIDSEALKDVYKWIHESKEIWQIRSLLVFKDNKLVAESYMKDQNDRTNLNNVWSCTKQVVGILTGIAIENNYIEAITDPISKYLPQALNTDKSQITIEKLLTMQSGINYNNAGLSGQTAALLQQKPANSIDFILGLDMLSDPSEFWYNDGNPQLMSAIIQKQTGKTTRDWAKEVLFNKIGFNRYEWIIYKDGITMGGFGIKTTPRELAKIGQLILNDGKWNGQQIVSHNWLSEMTSTKVPLEDNFGFGYFWWIENSRGVFYMSGSGGQNVFINKSKGLMIVITSEQNTQGNFQMSEGFTIYDRINNITN